MPNFDGNLSYPVDLATSYIVLPCAMLNYVSLLQHAAYYGWSYILATNVFQNFLDWQRIGIRYFKIYIYSVLNSAALFPIQRVLFFFFFKKACPHHGHQESCARLQIPVRCLYLQFVWTWYPNTKRRKSNYKSLCHTILPKMRSTVWVICGMALSPKIYMIILLLFQPDTSSI